MRVLAIGCVVLWAITMRAQTTISGGVTVKGGVTITGTLCGPPTFPCSSTSLAAAQVTSIPNLGGLTGAGTVITDTSIPGNTGQIARCTDSATDASFPGTSWIVDPGGSGDGNLWNADSTEIIVSRLTNNYFMNFNPSTMACTLRYAATNHYTGASSWSYTNPKVDFVIGGGANGTAILSYDTTSTSTFPTPTTVFDFDSSSNCLGSSYVATWNGSFFVNKFPTPDIIMGTAFSSAGGQGSGGDVVSWKSGSGCRHWNTLTGVISGDWGTNGTIAIGDRFKIHDVQMSKDGTVMIVAMQNNTCTTTCPNGLTYFWTVAGTSVVAGQPSSIGGHTTEGSSVYYNNNNSPLWQWVSRTFASPTSPTTLLSSFPPGSTAPTDTHAGNSFADASDTHMFFQSQADAGAFCCLGNYPSAGTAEVLGVDPTGSLGTLKRFFHTLSTGQSLIFDTAQVVMTCSQDGRFCAWSSDDYGKFGKNDGVTSSCTAGGPNWQASHTYSVTTTAACIGTVSNTNCVDPFLGNSGNYLFAATAVSGPSGSTRPTWSQDGVTLVTDGGVTWTPVGQPNCRGDVLIGRMQ